MTFLEARALIYNSELLIKNTSDDTIKFITAIIWPNAKYTYKYFNDKLIIQDSEDSNEWLQTNKLDIPYITSHELVKLFYEIKLDIDDVQTLEF